MMIKTKNKNQFKSPNFFIIGAPKCGTTSLAKWLSEHPNIFISIPKEPHYFNFDLSYRNIQTIDRYKSLFRKASSQHIAIGEASTWYLYSKVAIDNIEATFPHSRFIVMTRNPADMAYSLYLHNLRHFYENATHFEIAWNMQDLRKKGKNIPSSCKEPEFLQYRKVCSLGTQLERLLTKVSQDRIMHISLNQMKTEPELTYSKVLSYLGVKNDNRTDFTPENPARLPQNKTLHKILITGGKLRKKIGINKGIGLLKLNEKPTTQRIPTNFKSILEKEFFNEIKALNELSTKLNK